MRYVVKLIFQQLGFPFLFKFFFLFNLVDFLFGLLFLLLNLLFELHLLVLQSVTKLLLFLDVTTKSEFILFTGVLVIWQVQLLLFAVSSLLGVHCVTQEWVVALILQVLWLESLTLWIFRLIVKLLGLLNNLNHNGVVLALVVHCLYIYYLNIFLNQIGRVNIGKAC